MLAPSFVPENQFKDYQQAVDEALLRWLPPENVEPIGFHQAMRYAVLGNGKRLRPVLVFATGEALDVPKSALAGPACAVELIHAYSLVHDDLPAMDNDDLRRGRPTCHKAFDEATAMLAGDALQTLAFQILATDPDIIADARQRLRMVEVLAQASGYPGMAGGQAMDLAAVGRDINIAELENIHIHKTGALIRASVQLGALSLPQVDEAVLNELDHFAKCIGLAFQIWDDVLDVEGATEVIGKTQGSDDARNKPTYPKLLGMAEAKRAALELYERAVAHLDILGERQQALRGIAEFVVKRER
jgi:farnesyl diphosphate synthase